MEVFEKVNSPYREKLRNLFRSELDRLQDTEPQGRMFIETMEKAEERFERKLKREYRFVANPMREKLTVLMNARMLFS